jgi:hypothetical protein
VIVTVPLNGEQALTGHFSHSLQFLAVFIHVSPWQNNRHCFTVTAMSGNATTSAWHHGADDLSCEEAAALLGIPPAALDRWAQRLAFPHDVGGGQPAAPPRFRRAEIEALRDALVRSHSVEGAVRAARDRVGE